MEPFSSAVDPLFDPLSWPPIVAHRTVRCRHRCGVRMPLPRQYRRSADAEHDKKEPPVSDNDAKVRRTLQLRFTLPAADSQQLAAMIKAAVPFYQMFGNTQVRLLQNVDDPAKFVQEIEYEAQEDWELNRQRIATDIRMQTYLQIWRSMLPGAPEIDVYREV
jgi:L-lactate utilization protein LutB